MYGCYREAILKVIITSQQDFIPNGLTETKFLLKESGEEFDDEEYYSNTSLKTKNQS